MDPQRDQRDPRPDHSWIDLVRRDVQSESASKRELYPLAYELLPVATQERLQFVRWLVETHRLQP